MCALVAVLLGACHSHTEEEDPVTATKNMVVTPFTEAGEPLAGITITDEASGHCRPSRADPGNKQARRCFTSEASVVMDPCFLRPSADPIVPDVSHGTALCMTEPHNGRATQVTVEADVEPEEEEDTPWFVELANGARCSTATGVDRRVDGLPLTYGCDGDGYLYGAIDTSAQVWTVHHQAEGSKDTDEVPVRTAWR